MQDKPGQALKPQSFGIAHQVGEHNYYSITRKLIMNGDLNAAGKLFGGRLMEWVDEAAGLFCMTEIGTRQIVTKKISEVIFNEPAHLGDVLELMLRIKNLGNSSVTVECLVMTKVIAPPDTSRLIVQCDLVFVAIDRNGRPSPHGFRIDKETKPK